MSEAQQREIKESGEKSRAAQREEIMKLFPYFKAANEHEKKIVEDTRKLIEAFYSTNISTPPITTEAFFQGMLANLAAAVGGPPLTILGKIRRQFSPNDNYKLPITRTLLKMVRYLTRELTASASHASQDTFREIYTILLQFCNNQELAENQPSHSATSRNIIHLLLESLLEEMARILTQNQPGSESHLSSQQTETIKNTLSYYTHFVGNGPGSVTFNDFNGKLIPGVMSESYEFMVNLFSHAAKFATDRNDPLLMEFINIIIERFNAAIGREDIISSMLMKLKHKTLWLTIAPLEVKKISEEFALARKQEQERADEVTTVLKEYKLVEPTVLTALIESFIGEKTKTEAPKKNNKPASEGATASGPEETLIPNKNAHDLNPLDLKGEQKTEAFSGEIAVSPLNLQPHIRAYLAGVNQLFLANEFLENAARKLQIGFGKIKTMVEGGQVSEEAFTDARFIKEYGDALHCEPLVEKYLATGEKPDVKLIAPFFSSTSSESIDDSESIAAFLGQSLTSAWRQPIPLSSTYKVSPDAAPPAPVTGKTPGIP